MKRRSQHQQRCGHGMGRGVGCKHSMSAHRYEPGHVGPQHCSVAHCRCPIYVDPRTAYFSAWVQGEHAGDYHKLSEAEHEAKLCSKERHSATVIVHAGKFDHDGQIVAEYRSGKKF